MGNVANVTQIVLLVLVLFGVLATIAITIATIIKVYKVAAPTSPTIIHYTNGPVPPNSPLEVPYRQVSDLFRSIIDISADPCNDFYKFTCGNYNDLVGSGFDRLNELNMRLMVQQMDDPAYRDSAEACKTGMDNWSSITADASNVKSKLQMFQAATELAFPLLQQDLQDPPMPDKTTLATAIGYLDGVLQTETFLSSEIDTNWRDPQSTQGYMLMIDQATLTFPPPFYLKAWDLTKDTYRDRVMTWMNQLETSLNQTKLGEDVDDILNLEESIRRNFGDLLEGVIAGLRSMIDELKWMSATSKKGAYYKIDHLVKNIAYPDFIVDDLLLREYYAALDIASGDSYTTMTEKLKIFDSRKSFESLAYNQTQRDDFNGPPGNVNAWYQPELNSITFPAAILQQPFYDPYWPASVNYGGIGAVSGHELVHAFDDVGIQWDGTGVLYNWMDNSSYAFFQDMAECVIKEYGCFCPLPFSYQPSNCIDGTQTQGENIADNGGIRAAYRAYKNYINLNGPEPLLNDPIMSQFTHDQLFFMSFAKVFCSESCSDEKEHLQILVDAHSPFRYRVLGTIQNYPAFRSAFNCPLHTKYAPENHCNVWVSPVEASYGLPEEDRNSELNVPPPQQMQPDQPAKYNAYLDAVQMFKESLNITANPCTNFYDYACGNFDKFGTSFSNTNRKNFREMAAQMELSKYSNPQTPTALTKTIQFYKACKAVHANIAANIKDGTVVLNALEDFKFATGLQFSMVYNQSSTYTPDLNKFTMAKAIGSLSRSGIDTLLSASVDTNWVTADSYKFFLDQNVLYYPKAYYTQIAWETIFALYKQNTIDLFNHFAALVKVTLNQTKLSNDVEALLDFEKTLANSYSTSDTVRQQFKRSYNPYSIPMSEVQFGFVDFPTYLASLAGDFQQLVDYFVNPELMFLVVEPEMIKKLSTDFLEKKFDPSVVANYFFYRILTENSRFLPTPANYRTLEIVSDEIQIGRRRQKSRRPMLDEKAVSEEQLQMHCASETIEEMKYANARFFIDFHYPDQASRDRIRQSVSNIIVNIKLAFRGMLDSLEWMDDVSRQGAYNKLDNLKQNIAYPPFITNDTLLDLYYEELIFTETDTYFTMLHKLEVFNYRLMYKRLLSNEKVDRNDFLGAPGIVNAWYQPELNSITFPAGILQHPYYDENWPTSINYGGLALVSGHELTHGFDDEGVQWNGMGALQDWLTNASNIGFKAMANCVVKEYSEFCPLAGTGKLPSCVNGEQTQGENIADNGGIHAAWNAYQMHVALNGPDPQLPDPVFNQFTHDQLFFMSFAQVWCRKQPSDNALYRQLLTDPHSPSRYRILGTIQNFPAFRIAFNCPPGLTYDPLEHCSVWVPKLVP